VEDNIPRNQPGKRGKEVDRL